ncbi:MAG: family containing protein [Chitinophagaceae bacterium]|nr:family containing protein [Chitinophagaceae bacterium]
MKKLFGKSVNCLLSVLCFIIISLSAEGKSSKKDFYEIKIYNLKTDEQVVAVDQYLKNAYLPALHRAGISKVGVFKPLANDTAQVKKIYVFIPFHSLQEWQKLPQLLEKDDAYISSAKEFTDAPADKKPFERIESILLDAFPMHTHFEVSGLKNPLSQRVYELRSYESPTEHLHKTKVRMFNEGGEIALFKRLNFNAIFYARVLSGSRMPNLMYLTTFENMADRDTHWKAFGSSPEWKALIAMPEYENKVSVSRNETIFIRPTDYSDL